ncbi:MAG: HlyD family efflux transporter periplasmic adaptor subunit [Bacteroidota bacterium]
MKRRQWTIVVGLVILIGGFALMRVLSALKEDAEKQPTPPRKRFVQVQTVHNGTVRPEVTVTGRLVARNRVELYSEVNGLLLSGNKEFRQGVRYAAGETLLRLDDREVRQNLLAQKSAFVALLAQQLSDLQLDYPETVPAWKAYMEQLDIEQPLAELPEPASPQARLFLSARGVYERFHTIKGQEARLDKYAITAPFSGTIAEAAVLPGSLIRPGQKLGEFIGTDAYELECAVSPEQLGFIRIGDTARLLSEANGKQWTGTITRINDRVEANSQTARVYIRTEGADLREGYYLQSAIRSAAIPEALQVPRKWLVDNAGLFLVRDSALHLVPVDVVQWGAEYATVKGLPEGETLVAERIPGAHEGMVVAPMAAPDQP